EGGDFVLELLFDLLEWVGHGLRSSSLVIAAAEWLLPLARPPKSFIIDARQYRCEGKTATSGMRGTQHFGRSPPSNRGCPSRNPRITTAKCGGPMASGGRDGAEELMAAGGAPRGD